MPNAYDKTVDAILDFLKLPQNAALQQEILQDVANIDLSFSVNKLQKLMQGQVSTTGLLWHGRDFGEALLDAVHELKKTAPPVTTSEEALMDVLVEGVGDKKVLVVSSIIKVRGWDLKKTMKELDHLPTLVFEAVPASKAHSAQKALEEAGAQVTVRPTEKP